MGLSAVPGDNTQESIRKGEYLKIPTNKDISLR
jgi:hypothetical protein